MFVQIRCSIHIEILKLEGDVERFKGKIHVLASSYFQMKAASNKGLPEHNFFSRFLSSEDLSDKSTSNVSPHYKNNAKKRIVHVF